MWISSPKVSTVPMWSSCSWHVPRFPWRKYLQQVGRGLRRSANKASCMLIDNVGLYRIFGLPARNHDWAAMFEGRMIGNALSRARTEGGLYLLLCH